MGTKKQEVICIAAVGRSGQIGNNGKLPWSKRKGDLPWFREQTMGHVVVFGKRTYDDVGALEGRTTVEQHIGYECLGYIHSESYAGGFRFDPNENHCEVILRHFSGRKIFVAGGANTYRVWAPYVTRMMISRIDYDGEADTWFPWDAYGVCDVPVG